MKKLTLYFLLLLITGTSCVSLKKIKYIQDATVSQSADSVVYQAKSPDYLIQPGDHLYIDVKNIDTKSMNPFQTNNNVNYQTSNEAGVYLNSYLVSDSGSIDFPLVGKVFVKGKTINEVQSTLQQVVNEFFQLTTVSVKLVNFRISMLGEVARPGTYMIYQNEMNILQAISMAGDLSNYANRREINIIRKHGNGSNVYKVNLLDARILNSPAYYLQPGDVVYVEPLKGKNFTFTAFPYAILFSTISTTLLILNFIK
jgi:polysaccharide export outer membrane protein